MEKSKSASLIKDQLKTLKNDLSNLDPNFSSQEIDSYSISLDNIIAEVDQLEKRQKGINHIFVAALMLILVCAFLLYQTNKYQNILDQRIDQVTKMTYTADSILTNAKSTDSVFDKTTEEITRIFKIKQHQQDSLLGLASKYRDSLQVAKYKISLAQKEYGISFRERVINNTTIISIYTEYDLFKKGNNRKNKNVLNDTIK
ncbi:hypothetical protein [Chryseobacterium aquifrigidense]|uniref:Uncharacterized protein n=1 Tax=Chryseobacterium aquifrigidense TaxID=558021 RepID=A0A543E9T1_9FLAO|nr:hypothetical protein [Chryseobacterium aquifrigidense]TQM18347.1 hypothetical protein FB551_4128 [Chryseobacterium aquifrigidense]